MPGTVLDAGDTTVNETLSVLKLFLMEGVGPQTNEIIPGVITTSEK